MLDKEATTEEWLKGHAPIDSGASLPDGSEVGRWRTVAFIARGGSGEVYRAVEVDGQRMAALKILHRTDAAAVARFAREVQVLSELRDRAFPVFFESGTFGGRPWYATEFLLPLDMPATDRSVARFIVAVCRGAGALHKLGYVHRDIKPANILFRKDEPVLIDLGLLKKADTPALHVGGTVSVVDGRPVGVGTPGYAAPEQFMGGEISPAADIHAIGVLASVCFGGRPPRAWRAIIRRATSSLPGERYPDVAALARAVRLRHLPTALGAAAVAVAFAALAVLAAMWSRKAPQHQLTQVAETRETIASEPKSKLTPASAPQPEPSPTPEPEPKPMPTFYDVRDPKTAAFFFNETVQGDKKQQGKSPADSTDGEQVMDDASADAKAMRATVLIADGLADCRKGNLRPAGGKLWQALEIARTLQRQFGDKYALILAKANVAYAEFHHLTNPDISNATPLVYVVAGIELLEKLPERNEGEVKANLDRAVALQTKILADKGLKFVYSKQLNEKRLVSKNRKNVAKLAEDMVRIPGRDYEICKSEVTQSLWKEIMGEFMKDARAAAKEDPEHLKNMVAGLEGIENPSFVKGGDLPVTNVSVSDIEQFLSWLNNLPEVKFYGVTYRLPTAEEWEYACLAGGTNGFCRLADGTQITPETLGEAAWFAGNSGNKPHPVCKKKPNAFGLYDMHGNVAEFTSTRNPEAMFDHIWKGNAYNGEDPTAFRADSSPSTFSGLRHNTAGFRLAR